MGSTVIPELTIALSNDNSSIRSAVAFLLGELGSKAASAIPDLAKALRDANHSVRFEVVEAIHVIRADPAITLPVLIPAISDPDQYVRLAAVDAVASYGSDAAVAVPSLVDRLREDKANGVARHAADALREIRQAATAAVPALVREISGGQDTNSASNEEFSFSVSAAAALVAISPTNQTPRATLMKAASGDYCAYTLLAAKALLEIQPPERDVAIKALKWVAASSCCSYNGEAWETLAELGLVAPRPPMTFRAVRSQGTEKIE
jgi:HEAT repeat protein